MVHSRRSKQLHDAIDNFQETLVFLKQFFLRKKSVVATDEKMGVGRQHRKCLIKSKNKSYYYYLASALKYTRSAFEFSSLSGLWWSNRLNW